MFEVPVSQAKQKKLEELAQRDQSYKQASQYFKQSSGITGSFG
jgi:hypothetical protein